MKSIFLKSISFVLLTIGLWSCKKDETKTVSDVSPAGTLTASATSLNLVQANADKPAVTLSFPAPSVTGYQIPVTSTLQFDLKGNNFKAAKEVVVATTSYTPLVSEMNTMLLGLGLKVGVPGQIEIRLKSAPAPNAVTYSNVLTLSATPYLASSWIYVPGAYQGWTPATADSLISLTSNKIYTGVISFPAGNLIFKVTPKKNWDAAYGDAGGGNISLSASDNLAAPAAGVYVLTVDLNKNTITYTPIVWSIIGDATAGGWSTDTDMAYAKGVWKVTASLTKGQIKFRQNHDWGINYGGSDGNAVLGSPNNIDITAAGNYTITLNVTTAKYTITKN